MDILTNLADGFAALFGGGGAPWWHPPLAAVAGVAVGIGVGVMPGLSASTGIALLVPFTYGMDPLTALVLLISVYLATAYGGSVTAIAINTPGTPSSAAVGFDGYAMTQQGRPGYALGLAVATNVSGGLLGALVLIAFSGPLARAALTFGPPEYFALAVFGLTIVSSLEAGNALKGFLSTLLGLLVVTMGLDPVTGVMRYTFGLPVLNDGISFIPALIGLFAVGEVLLNIERMAGGAAAVARVAGDRPSLRGAWAVKGHTALGGLIGTLVGVVPGAGATIAAFLAYNEGRRFSRKPELFGKGSPEGLAAPSAAEGGSVGGALVPLLTLGIPGSAATAVLVGALMLHGVTPGPELFSGGNIKLVHGLFAALILGNVLLLALGLLGTRLWVRIIEAPRAVLFPLILVVALVGSYGVANSLFDVWVCVAFGALGWVLRRYGFPTAPLVLALILGEMAEVNLRRALIMGDVGIFFTRPVSLTLLVLATASFAWPFVRARRR